MFGMKVIGRGRRMKELAGSVRAMTASNSTEATGKGIADELNTIIAGIAIAIMTTAGSMKETTATIEIIATIATKIAKMSVPGRLKPCLPPGLSQVSGNV
jgi:hypothetical protein